MVNNENDLGQCNTCIIEMYKIMQFKNLIFRHNLNFILSKIANETDYASDLFSSCPKKAKKAQKRPKKAKKGQKRAKNLKNSINL